MLIVVNITKFDLKLGINTVINVLKTNVFAQQNWASSGLKIKMLMLSENVCF